MPLQNFIAFIIGIIDRLLVPLLFAIAFIVFIWGVFQYFIAGAGEEEKRSEGKKFVLYGLIGFFLMLSIWGIVNLFVSSFGFNSQARPPLPTFGGSQSGTTVDSNRSNNGFGGSGTGSNRNNQSGQSDLTCSPGSELSRQGESPTACCARAFGAGQVFDSTRGCIQGQ